MKTPALSALLGVSLLVSPASGTILLNEIHINPPPTLDLNYEYIELRSTTNGVEACSGLTLLIIENNGGQVGEVEEALNLDPYSTGTNGLLMIGNNYDTAPQGGPWSGFKAPATTVADPSGDAPWSGLGDDNIDPSGGLTFLLVRGWTGMTNATSSSLGDVDINNNSVLDWLENPRPAGSQATQPFETLVDSVGYRDLSNTPVRLPYTTADLSVRPGSAATFAPDNISRRLSRTATPGDQNNAAAWYGGNLLGTAANAFTYDVQFFGDFKGQATPGQDNLNAAPVPGVFLLNEVAVNPPGQDDGNFEYIEIVNAAAGGGAASLQGLALVLINSNDLETGGTTSLGRVREAWDLSPYATGPNGLLLLGQRYADGDLPWGGYVDPQTQLGDPSAPAVQNPVRWSSMGDNDIGNSNGFTLLLVQNFTGTIDQDLDTNNDGVLDVTPWTAIRDSIGFNQLAPGTGKSYATARITTTPAYEIANLSRKLGDATANTAASWYGGDYGGKSQLTTAFTNVAEKPPFGGFRGAATPGRTNLNAPGATAPIRINEIQLDPVGDPDGSREYIELVNTELTIGGMNGLTLVIADATPGASNGLVRDIIDLSEVSTGPNGLIILGDSYEDAMPWPASPLTVREDPTGLTGGNITPENGLIILVTKGTPPVKDSNISAIAAADIVDSIGFGSSPNPAVTLLSPGFDPDNVSRYPGSLAANTASSWFSGELDPVFGPTSLYYGSNFSGTYKGGASPGRHNHSASPSPTANLLLNELHINPPGGDNGNEFVEYRARPASSMSTNGWTLLTIDGSGNNIGTIVEAWSLDGLATGSNGLLMTGAGYPASLPWTGSNAPASGTGIGSPDGMGPGDIAGYNNNGTVSFLLVKNFTGRVGMDLDDGLNGGTPEGIPDDGTLDYRPWVEIVDAAGLRLWDTSLLVPGFSGTVYGGVDLSKAGYTPDNLSRRGDNATPLTAAAWYGGDIDGVTGTSTTFDPARQFPGAPFVASVTPGHPNAGSPVNDLGDDDNDGAVNLIEAALSMNPAVADPQNLPQTGLTVFGGTAYPTLSYTRFNSGSGASQAYSANGYLYEVQVSTNLVTWTNDAASVSVTARDAQTDTAVLRPSEAYFAAAQAAGRPVFLRLRVSRL